MPGRRRRRPPGLANAAALAGKDVGFLVYGINDKSREIVGTSFDPARRKIGNEDLDPWLLRLLDPQVGFTWGKVDVDGRMVIVLRVDRASSHPVAFKGRDYIRVGSYTKQLKDHPEHARRLWPILDSYSFEESRGR